MILVRHVYPSERLDHGGAVSRHPPDEVLGSETIKAAVRSVALSLADRVYAEGLDTSGGLMYEGQEGRIADPNREWWPQAEAVVGFLNTYQLTGKAYFFDAALKIWDFIEHHIVDRNHGEWEYDLNYETNPPPVKRIPGGSTDTGGLRA